MTKITVIVKREVQEEKIIGYSCNWCGNKFDTHNWGDETESYETELQLRSYNNANYGWEVGGESWVVEDLCPDCAKKLPDALESLGMTIKHYYW